MSAYRLRCVAEKKIPVGACRYVALSIWYHDAMKQRNNPFASFTIGKVLFEVEFEASHKVTNVLIVGPPQLGHSYNPS